jgi:hypothetical protein
MRLDIIPAIFKWGNKPKTFEEFSQDHTSSWRLGQWQIVQYFLFLSKKQKVGSFLHMNLIHKLWNKSEDRGNGQQMRCEEDRDLSPQRLAVWHDLGQDFSGSQLPCQLSCSPKSPVSPIKQYSWTGNVNTASSPSLNFEVDFLTYTIVSVRVLQRDRTKWKCVCTTHTHACTHMYAQMCTHTHTHTHWQWNWFTWLSCW